MATYPLVACASSYKDNAKAVFPEPVLTPQEAFDTYLTHASAQEFFVEYVNASIAIAAAGKEFISKLSNSRPFSKSGRRLKPDWSDHGGCFPH